MRITGARRPENAKKQKATAPKNTINLNSVGRKAEERHAGLAEATNHLEISLRTHTGNFRRSIGSSALQCSYYSHEIRTLQACSTASRQSHAVLSGRCSYHLRQSSRRKGRNLMHYFRVPRPPWYFCKDIIPGHLSLLMLQEYHSK